MLVLRAPWTDSFRKKTGHTYSSRFFSLCIFFRHCWRGFLSEIQSPDHRQPIFLDLLAWLLDHKRQCSGAADHSAWLLSWFLMLVWSVCRVPRYWWPALDVWIGISDSESPMEISCLESDSLQQADVDIVDDIDDHSFAIVEENCIRDAIRACSANDSCVNWWQNHLLEIYDFLSLLSSCAWFSDKDPRQQCR